MSSAPVVELRYRSTRTARVEALPSPFRGDARHALKVAAALVLNAVFFGLLAG
jgi:hypothetical protein